MGNPRGLKRYSHTAAVITALADFTRECAPLAMIPRGAGDSAAGGRGIQPIKADSGLGWHQNWHQTPNNKGRRVSPARI